MDCEVPPRHITGLHTAHLLRDLCKTTKCCFRATPVASLLAPRHPTTQTAHPRTWVRFLGRRGTQFGVSSINSAQIPRPRFGFRSLRIYPHFPLRRQKHPLHRTPPSQKICPHFPLRQKIPPSSDSAHSQNLPPLPASERNSVPDSAYRINIFQLS